MYAIFIFHFDQAKIQPTSLPRQLIDSVKELSWSHVRDILSIKCLNRLVFQLVRSFTENLFSFFNQWMTWNHKIWQDLFFQQRWIRQILWQIYLLGSNYIIGKKLIYIYNSNNINSNNTITTQQSLTCFTGSGSDIELYNQHRYRLGVGEGPVDHIPEKALPLECNLVLLNGGETNPNAATIHDQREYFN